MAQTMTREERVDYAVETLKQAIEAGVIRNARFQECKDILNDAIWKDCDALSRALRDNRPGSEMSDEIQDLYYSIPSSLHGLTSFIKKYDKALKAGHVKYGQAECATYIAKWLPIGVRLAAAKHLIVKGREPKPVEDLTGVPTRDQLLSTCYCCGKETVTQGDRLVWHGYKISEGYGHYFGQRLGSCLGTGRVAWEISPEIGKFLLDMIKSFIETKTSSLVHFQTREATVWVREYRGRGKYENVAYNPGDIKYDQHLDSQIREIEYELKAAKCREAKVTTDLKNWSKKPLKTKKVKA